MHPDDVADSSSPSCPPVSPPTRSLREIRARAEMIRREAAEFAARRGHERLAWYEEQLGPETFAELMASPEASEHALTASQPIKRQCAITLLMDHWGLAERFVGRCESILQNDPDPGVRSLALIKLASHYRGTDEPRIGVLFAQIVRAADEPNELRRDAYRGLIYLRNLSLNGKPDVLTLRFPEDVDWSFVDSFTLSR